MVPLSRGNVLDVETGFEGVTLVLIASFPGHCLSFTFDIGVVYILNDLATEQATTSGSDMMFSHDQPVHVARLLAN